MRLLRLVCHKDGKPLTDGVSKKHINWSRVSLNNFIFKFKSFNLKKNNMH